VQLALQDHLWESVEAAPHCDAWDMPLAEYVLASGRRKRRVCGTQLHAIFTELSESPDVARALRERRFHVVVERPSPQPAQDGWQSAAVAGVA
jgi:hypothetical protein